MKKQLSCWIWNSVNSNIFVRCWWFCKMNTMCLLLERREKHLEYLINHLLWIDLFKWGSSLSINIMSLFALHCISSNETVSLAIGNLMVHLNLRWTSILHYLAVMNGHFQPASMAIGPVKIYFWFSYKTWFLFVTGCKFNSLTRSMQL